MPHVYQAYGLTIASTIPLAALVAGSAPPDVQIHPATITPKPLPPLTTNSTTLVSADDIRITYPNIGTFLVRQGSEIQFDLNSGVTGDVIQWFILGPMFGILLHQRGLLTLHGSCVGIAHNAVAFLAPSTGGKSTMAGTMYSRGHALLADDITALDINDESVNVLPAFPHLKLWPEAATFLDHHPDTLPRIFATEEKRLLSAQVQFSLDAVPLRQIYVLDDGDHITIDRLPRQEATIELLRHSYCAQIEGYVTPPEYFLRCAALARRLPIYRISRPRIMEQITEIAKAVEDNLAQSIDE